MNSSREEQFNRLYMDIALRIAGMSHEREDKKVGAVIVNEHGNMLSFGFNGTPRGFPNECTYYDTELKRERAKPEVLHAESNAITNAARDGIQTYGTSLYTVVAPCFSCAQIIIQTGIKAVYYLYPYKNTEGVEQLERAWIPIIQLPLSEENPVSNTGQSEERPDG